MDNILNGIVFASTASLARYLTRKQQLKLQQQQQEQQQEQQQRQQQEQQITSSGSGCPFGFSSSSSNSNGNSRGLSSSRNQDNKTTTTTTTTTSNSSNSSNSSIRNYRPGYYEDYIKLPVLSQIWNAARSRPTSTSSTASSSVKRDVEPYLTSSLQGVELGFLLLAMFIKDSSSYLVMRPRIELISRDIICQVCAG